MFPAQRGLYGHRSTMNQFAKPGYHFMNFDPFPFTNANLTADMSGNKSPLMQYPSSSDDLFDADLAKEDATNSLSTKKPLSKAERRAEHNAIERARRENLNTKFQSLAQALPNLINYRRPSKSQIVEKALDWVKQSISREERYRYQVLQLQRENKRLLAQLMQPQETPAASAPVSAMAPPLIRQQSMQMPSAPMMNAASSNTNIPHMYTDLSSNNGWSINSTNHYMVPTPQMTPYSSTEELTKQDFSSKSDDEDNVSSANEDDIEYQSSPCNPSYLEHGSPQNQYEANHQQNHRALMAAELYPVGFQSNDTHFDPNMMNTWSSSKYSPSMMNSGNIDPGLGSRSASTHML
ncbi:subunit of the Arp2/3 complex [Mucor velutinosus]|uniref:Subunit of the Arp2/3 complex n=1 Tax=Mucor velutinosus TaxID=708070 RepID=A0AAN7DK11_9FUNG|nr:subunit of the Arp2/3 complex [Mucor velutinosus]